MTNMLFGFLTPGPMEMIIIGVIAVLLFGKRLPEVGRSLGRGIIEFKKGIGGIEDEIDSAATASTSTASTSTASTATATPESASDRQEPTAPKFEPPASEPKAETVGE